MKRFLNKYQLADIIFAGLAFISFFFISEYFGSAMLGEYGYYNIISNYIWLFTSMGFQKYIPTVLLNDTEIEIKKFLNSLRTYFIILASIIISIALILFVLGLIESKLFMSILFGMTTSLLLEPLFQYFKATNNDKRYFKLRVYSGLVIFLSLIMVYNFNLSQKLLNLYALLFIFTLTLYIVFKPNIYFSFELDNVFKYLKKSSPLVIHSISLTILIGFDRIILKEIIGFENLGKYILTYQVFSIINMYNQGFNKSITHLYKSKTNISIIKQKFNFNILLIISFCVLIIPFMFLLNMLNINVMIDQEILVLLSLIMLWQSYYTFNSNDISLFQKKPQRLIKASIPAAFICVILCYLLIPVLGVLGALIATMFGYLTLAILTFKMAIFLKSNKNTILILCSISLILSLIFLIN